MKLHQFLTLATASLLALATIENASAQGVGELGPGSVVDQPVDAPPLDSLPEPAEAARRIAPRPVLSRERPPSLRDGLEGLTPMEIRQARALYQMRQRIARLERNAWLGYDPLRPQWTAIPMTNSGFQPRRVLRVPVYVHP